MAVTVAVAVAVPVSVSACRESSTCCATNCAFSRASLIATTWLRAWPPSCPTWKPLAPFNTAASASRLPVFEIVS
ncbi:hypothetical protein HDV63DRAFT_207235 [Trichoderma sp. SZMC 28014]